MDRLRELRDPKTTDVLMTSMTSFFADVWKQDDDVSSFLARLAVHTSRVNGCGKEAKITDEFVMAKTLSTHPPAFGNFVSSWYLIGKKDPTLSEFREKLLTAERGLNDTRDKDLFASGQSEAHDALQAKSRRGKRFPSAPSSPGSSSNGECHYCQRKGHFKRDCRKRIADEKRNGNEDRGGGGGKQQALTAFAFASRTSAAIVADTGASRHLSGQREWFRSLKKLDTAIPLSTADSEIHATHVGDISVDVSPDGKKWIRRVWEDVLYVPGMPANLFSTTWMERRSYSFTHGNKSARLTGKGKVICTASWDGSAYLMDMRVVPPAKGNAFAASLMLWHQRLGHVSDEVVKKMVKDEAAKGMFRRVLRDREDTGWQHRFCDFEGRVHWLPARDSHQVHNRNLLRVGNDAHASRTGDKAEGSLTQV